jgi:starvation-inducible DNA-binding protein
MKSSTLDPPVKTVSPSAEAEPRQVPAVREIQPYGTIARLPNGLPDLTCQAAAKLLNLLLADTMTLRDLYKKHHWQVSGPNFYQFHLLFDKHYEQQAELVDAVAERIQTLGGIAIAMAHDVAERTQIPRPPIGREAVPVQVSRLLEAHEMIVRAVRNAAKELQESDLGTTDLLISQVLRTNEMQIWFLSEHLVHLSSNSQ